MSISSVLKRRRAELNYTLLDVANKVGVSEATVQRWESGNIKNLRHERISVLAKVLEVSPVELMGWEEQKKPTTMGELSENERNIIELFRSTSPQTQQAVEGVLKAATQSPPNKDTPSK